MMVAGSDAHATYVVVAIVSNDGALIQKPLRIQNAEAARLLELLDGVDLQERPVADRAVPSPEAQGALGRARRTHRHGPQAGSSRSRHAPHRRGVAPWMTGSLG
jgi:hypothetical protein